MCWLRLGACPIAGADSSALYYVKFKFTNSWLQRISADPVKAARLFFTDTASSGLPVFAGLRVWYSVIPEKW